MGAPPPQAIRNAIENGVTQVTRRVAAYEADGTTLWIPDPDDPAFNRLVDGNISLDYMSDERRKLDITLLNDDGRLRPNPRGGFYYDKIIKVFRGVQYSPLLTAPPIALADFDGTYQDKVTLTRVIRAQGYDLVDLTSFVDESEFDNYTVIMAVTFTRATTVSAVLKRLFNSGKSVVTLSTYNTASEVPYFTSTTNTSGADYGFSPSGEDSPLAGAVVGSTALGTAAGTRVVGVSQWARRSAVWTSTDGVNHVTASVGTNTKSASWMDLHVTPQEHSVYLNVLKTGFDYMRGKSSGILTWEYQLGEFMIDGINDQLFPNTIKLTGRDYTKKLLTDKISQASTYARGTSLKDFIIAISANAGISKFRVSVGSETLPSDVSYDRGTVRWQIIKDVCTSFGYEVFFDNEGYLVVRAYLDPYTSKIAHKFLTGQVGNLIDYSRSVNDSRIYNIVNVYGDPGDQNSGQLPFFGTAVNDNPNSPTSIGRIGKRPTSFASTFYTSDQQCKDTAQKMLAISALESYEANFTSLYYPWLEVGEIAEIIDPNAIATDPTRFLMDTLSLPLGLAPMTGTAKRVTIVGTAGTPS